MTAALKQWQGAGQDAGFLLPAGRPLLDGETLLREQVESLFADERTYIARSIAAESRRRMQRARVRAAVMTGLGG